MTTYYWIVAKDGHSESLAQVFKECTLGTKGAFWCAADANGKPVLFNHATTSAEAGKVAGHATLVGQAEASRVYVDPQGKVQTAGFEYCRAQGIRASAADIYAHAQKNMSLSPATVERLAVQQ